MEAQLLGSGGYGTVYRAEWHGHVCAAKVISKKHAATVARELAALRKLPPHPHVCGFLASEERANDAVLYLELCEGDLHVVVERGGALEESKAVEYALQMHRAIAHLHEHDIAHRDLKLENWLIRRDALKLGDFGLSCLRRAEPYREFVGSLSYCSPEVLGRSIYDPFVSDVWSYGVCVFSMSSAFFPFEQASNEDWRFQRVYRTTNVCEAIFALYDRSLHFTRLVPLVDAALQPPHQRAPLATLKERIIAAPPPAAPPTDASSTRAASPASPTLVGEVHAEEILFKSSPLVAPPMLKRLLARTFGWRPASS